MASSSIITKVVVPTASTRRRIKQQECGAARLINLPGEMARGVGNAAVSDEAASLQLPRQKVNPRRDPRASFTYWTTSALDASYTSKRHEVRV
jgi:hypothetical protein